jgi:hypothetical protein
MTVLTAADFDQIKKLVENYIYIPMLDQRYHHAVKDLMEQAQIAVHVENVPKGRHSKMAPILTICSRSQIYIFDLTLIGGILGDLKTLLENDSTLKIVANSKVLCDFLQHAYRVKMTYIFDLVVAHSSVCPSEEWKAELDAQEMAYMYMGIPEDMFRLDDVILLKPFTNQHKRKMANNIVLHFRLHDFFVYKIMLQPFLKQCTDFSQKAAGLDFCGSAMKMLSQTDIKSVSPFQLSFKHL